MATERACPHGGYGAPGDKCGTSGLLCMMCREDRADRRTRQLVEGLALAGLLANSSVERLDQENLEESAMSYVATLRERKGGEV